MIEGVIIYELKQIIDERGKVMHMLRSDSFLFNKFGEIYFSVVNPGKIKAWKCHLRMTQHIAVPFGKIKLVIYDNRANSSTKGKFEELYTGENNYCLIKIPPLLWYGFQGLSEYPALIANCTDIVHDPSEVQRLDLFNDLFTYEW